MKGADGQDGGNTLCVKVLSRAFGIPGLYFILATEVTEKFTHGVFDHICLQEWWLRRERACKGMQADAG